MNAMVPAGMSEARLIRGEIQVKYSKMTPIIFKIPMVVLIFSFSTLEYQPFTHSKQNYEFLQYIIHNYPAIITKGYIYVNFY